MTEVSANRELREPVRGLHQIPPRRAVRGQEDDGRMADEMSVEQKIDALTSAVGSLDRKVDALDRKFDAVDQRFDAVDRRFNAVDQRFDAVDRKFGDVDRRIGGMEGPVARIEGIVQKLDAVAVSLDAARADIRLVAEGVDLANQWLDRIASEARTHYDMQHRLLGQVMRHVSVRMERLEGGRRRK